MSSRGKRNFSTGNHAMPINSITDRLQHITVLNHIIEILITGNNACSPAIIRPQTIPVRNPLPLIQLILMRINIVTTHLRKQLCCFIKLIQTIKPVLFSFNRVSPFNQ
ncbi:hypothetical protein SAMN06264855_1443 [Halorubrum vacuolatum]|uniref:Uncharacterized protein n=1 Tax=Halorubrum vacuolatum TaxID=63740 RepID=A0A238YHJ4_HALVU|nr:hypothetical protein SAMN06264855_1443 [Halorubrum vacuolatum]